MAKILVVDDDMAILDRIGTIVGADGHVGVNVNRSVEGERG